MEKLSMVCRFKTEYGKSLPRLLHLCLGAKKEKEHRPHEAENDGWARMWKPWSSYWSSPLLLECITITLIPPGNQLIIQYAALFISRLSPALY
jgi:hypothetical protein